LIILEDQEMTFEAYSYRTSSRFGSRIRISVEGETVTVTGPRIEVFLYRFWIAITAVIFALSIFALLASLILLDWRYLVAVPLLLVLHLVFSGTGAGSFWEMKNLEAFDTEYPATSFSVSTVKQIKIGRGWARKSLWLIILPYVSLINKVSEGRVVSFEAPDGQTGGDAVYAFYMHSDDEATVLAEALKGKKM